MLAREVYRPLAHTLVAAKEGVLPGAPACVAAEQIGVARRVAQGRSAGVMRADAGKDPLQLLQAALRVLLHTGGIGASRIRRRRPVGRAPVSACIIDES